MSAYRVVLCTCPTPDVADQLAESLVHEQLAACVNIVSNVRSVYRWKNEICNDPEVLLIVKTTAAQLDALTARVVELHPYECPEVIALPIEGGHAPYLAWIGDQS
jgi:periplasmic divalent cation tolerance protein